MKLIPSSNLILIRESNIYYIYIPLYSSKYILYIISSYFFLFWIGKYSLKIIEFPFHFPFYMEMTMPLSYHSLICMRWVCWAAAMACGMCTLVGPKPQTKPKAIYFRLAKETKQRKWLGTHIQPARRRRNKKRRTTNGCWWRAKMDPIRHVLTYTYAIKHLSMIVLLLS